METQRIEYVDTLRGFAIFLVTLGHVLEKCGYPTAPLYDFIYSFHMPLFFCISGFVMSLSFDRKRTTNKLTIKNVIVFIYAKFKGLMIPYYVWSLVAIPLFFYCYDGTLDYKRTLDSVFVSNTSFWFLPCLFGLSVVYIMYKYILNVAKGKDSIMLKILVCMFLGVLLLALYYCTKFDFIRSIINYLLPFFIGVFMSEYKNINKLVCDNSLVYTICLFTFCLIVGTFISPANGTVEKISRLICGIVSIPIFFNFFKNTSMHPKLKSVMEYIGRNTLIIYVLQFQLIYNLPVIPNLNIFMQICVFSAISVLLIALILLVSKLFEQNKFISQLFLGRKY